MDGGSILSEREPEGWAIVETRSNAELIAERSLIALGYDPLVIRYNKLLRGARIALDGRRIRSRKDELQPRPFIPGYLFLPLQHGDDATLVDIANGVRRLFRHRDAEGYLAKPKIIRGRIVEQMKAAALERDETPKTVREDLRLRMASGETVRALVMPALIATLISLDDKGRAEWVGELFGREVSGRIEDTSELELVEV